MTFRLAGLVLLLLTAPAMADLRWYMSAKTSIASQRLENSNHNGTIGNGSLFDGEPDGRLAFTGIEDETAGIGLALGRDLGWLKVEGELIWRYRTDWDLRARTHSIGTVTNVFSNISTTTLMLNVSRQQPISPRWSWEVGLGAGVAYNRVDSRLIERRDGAPVLEHADTGTQFAWGAHTGLSRRIDDRWRFSVSYRYLDMGDVEAGPFVNAASHVQASHVAHELQLSLLRGL